MGGSRTKGLDLAEEYFWQVGSPMLKKRFPDYVNRIAAGLVGDGSECFGYDDEISHDHDWGPGFCLWLSKQDYSKVARNMQSEYDMLPKEFAGFPEKIASEWGKERVGVFEIGDFYRQFIGFESPPSSLQEWRFIPETYLAVCTNGKVFLDQLGEFSRFRDVLLKYYPEDIRLKKIASRCMTIGRSGQYSFPRCAMHGEYVAAEFAKATFIRDAISMVFLLNRKYMPYYKWMHRALRDLPSIGRTIHSLMSELVEVTAPANDNDSFERRSRGQSDCIERICSVLITTLRVEGLSDSNSNSLVAHGPLVQSKIRNREIRDLNVWIE